MWTPNGRFIWKMGIMYQIQWTVNTLAHKQTNIQKQKKTIILKSHTHTHNHRWRWWKNNDNIHTWYLYNLTCIQRFVVVVVLNRHTQIWSQPIISFQLYWLFCFIFSTKDFIIFKCFFFTLCHLDMCVRGDVCKYQLKLQQ